MNLPLGVLFGIIAMIGWGIADFLAAVAVRKTSVFKTFVWSQIIGLVLFFIAFSLFFNFSLPSLSSIVWLLFAGFLGVISYLAYYKGLQVGKVPVVVPIASSWAAITVILGLVILHEALTKTQTIGVILAVIGTVLVSFRLRDLLGLKLKNLSIGVSYAVIAMLGWGVYFVPMKMLISELGWFLPIFFAKVISIFYLLPYLKLSKKDVSFPKNALILVLLIGFLETMAFISFGMGINSAYVSIVSPVAATFPVITITLARLFLKETIDFNQVIGIFSVLTGLVLLSL